MKKSIYAILISVALLASCNNQQSTTEASQGDSTTMPQQGEVNIPKINVELSAFASTLDPVCKMELSAHLTDTASYNGKLYGFCSPDCKQSFLANAESFIKTEAK